jgi:putative SOS response-associated peptidase YedK
MALAGLWEAWRSPAQETVRSFTIVTTTPNELCARVQNRTPVILPLRGVADMAWGGAEDDPTLKAMLGPYHRSRSRSGQSISASGM